MFKVSHGQEVYRMKNEYVLQLLLQKFCDKCLQTEDLNCNQLFERADDNLEFEEIEEKEALTEEYVATRRKFEESFRRWVMLLLILFSPKNNSNGTVFNVMYEGLSSTIDYLLDPDRDFVQERGKPPPKPKYSLPTQTNLVLSSTC